MSIQTSKKLGILGVSLIFFDAFLSVLLAIGTLLSSEWSIPTSYGIIRIIGIIIILIAIHNLANVYQSKDIFTNARWGVLAIIGTITGFISGPIITHTTLNAMQQLIALYIPTLIMGVFFIIAAFFVERSLNEIAEHSGISDFETAGKWLFIGAILTLILFGTIIMGIAFLILITAFSKLKNPKLTPTTNTTENSTLPQTTPTPTTNTQTKAYCAYCGNPILPENVYCPHCGQHT